jgi:hypothetical protein
MTPAPMSMMPYLHFALNFSRINHLGTLSTHNIRRYPMRVGLNSPSHNEQPYRKHT